MMGSLTPSEWCSGQIQNLSEVQPGTVKRGSCLLCKRRVGMHGALSRDK